mmetsp:Transcript_89754/g.187516  ORF Transcript_89754/g.187516 Transcript_89754/m.187516 type:complete len:211 (+) Transcript_89754:1259-1891(+)
MDEHLSRRLIILENKSESSVGVPLSDPARVSVRILQHLFEFLFAGNITQLGRHAPRDDVVQVCRNSEVLRGLFHHFPSLKGEFCGLGRQLHQSFDGAARELQLFREAISQLLDPVAGLNEFRRDQCAELCKCSSSRDVRMFAEDVGDEEGRLELQFTQFRYRNGAPRESLLDASNQAHVQPDHVRQIVQPMPSSELPCALRPSLSIDGGA